jgi:CrcB protein
MYLHITAIALGGSIGALMRFGVATGVNNLLGVHFPFGTLVANVSGCFLMGFLSLFLLDIFPLSVEWRAAIFVGFLGAFTTFSSFSLETLTLVSKGEHTSAFLNVLLSVFLCLMATWLGILLAKQI